MDPSHSTRKPAAGLLLACALTGLGGAGCYGEPPDANARMAQLEREGKALNASADELEERLMSSQAELQLWAELQLRHREVSAVACTNQTEHFNDMVRYVEYQQEKSRRLHRTAEPAFEVSAPVSVNALGSASGRGQMLSP